MNHPLISVVIASHNELPYNLYSTVKTIQETGGPWVEVVIVDDCSRVPICCLPANIVRNNARLGVGPSRHKGVEAAKADIVLITDAHMIFTNDWLKPLLDALNGAPRRVLCGQCVALTENAVDITHTLGTYNGARMIVHDMDEPNPRWRVLTAKWADDKPGQDNYWLSAAMGACYAMHKKFFLEIGGLRMLREFGGDEELLSIKTLLAGGEIRMFKALKVGHRFRDKTKVPYRITVETCLYNTMVTALTCCPPDVSKDLIAKMGPGREWMDAKEMVRVNKDAIEEHRVAMQPVLSKPWGEYLKAIAQIDG